MSDRTSIEWTSASWNPIRSRRIDGTGKPGWACTKPSPGCKNCYAESINKRLGTGLGYVVGAPVETYVDERALGLPMRWRKPRKIFVCSMTDLAGEFVTNEQIAQVFHVMTGEADARPAPEHIYQLLTKRPERLSAWFTWIRAMGKASTRGSYPAYVDALVERAKHEPPHPRVWIGCSVEDRARLSRLDDIRSIVAAVRWVSFEPLLEDLGKIELNGINWCVIGGESGRGARPCDLRWIQSIVDQCRPAGVKVFVKQLGARFTIDGSTGWNGPFKIGGKGGDNFPLWPETVRVREFPAEVSRG